MPRILIADDHALFRRGLEAFLKHAIVGANVHEADTPEQVLEFVQNEHWDLLLLDLSMPGRSDAGLIKDVHRHTSRIPILMLSGHPEEEFSVQMLRAGAPGFINKRDHLKRSPRL